MLYICTLLKYLTPNKNAFYLGKIKLVSLSVAWLNFFIFIVLLPQNFDLSQASSMVLMHLGRARLAEG